MHKILVLNGPNLNMLGTREPGVYGSGSLQDLEMQLRQLANEYNVELYLKQSNHEGEMVDIIHQTLVDKIDFIIINAAAYTHTSIALRDALSAVSLPFVEVHISNVYARKAFRQHSYLADIAEGVITGLGVFGYEAAFLYALHKLKLNS